MKLSSIVSDHMITTADYILYYLYQSNGRAVNYLIHKQSQAIMTVYIIMILSQYYSHIDT